jgi:hypothetical protein
MVIDIKKEMSKEKKKFKKLGVTSSGRLSLKKGKKKPRMVIKLRGGVS